ncbi:hypothetical protein GGI43DRAFT_424030 [Trichoderma evansii]
MRRSFPNIDFCLMVGIGGGAPSEPRDDPNEDIRLGDVVVSCPSVNSGGVLQYDFGKTMREGKFFQTGVLNKTSVVLSNIVSTLRARHRISESSIPQYISRMLESNEKMQTRFCHPGLEHDQLFRVDYEHPNGELSCRSCDREALVLRKPRKDTDPTIHYGLIGSANQVMRHGPTRERLRDEKNIICFEMEAAGLMDIFSCLVVRGICDYADSHKNKKWQPYAAVVAAAYAKEVLLATPAAEDVLKLSFGGEAIYHMLQSALHEFNLGQLLNILRLSNYRYQKSSIKPIHDDDPKFHWALRNIDFNRWSLERGPQTLYLTGFLPENSLCQLSLHVANRGKAAGYSVLSIFCSAMKPLVKRGELMEPREPSMATFLYRTPIIRSFFSRLLKKLNDILTWLKDALDCEIQGRLLVVIDELDVIKSIQERLVPFLKYIQQQKPNTKILLTSSERSETMNLFQDYLHIEYDKERKECLRSLQFENTRYDKISQEHEGSFEWIWTHKEYESWSTSDTSRLLYIQGKPGSGKSTLMKYFNRNLLLKEPAAQQAILARFFYSFRDGELQRSHYNMLLSILYDLLYQDEGFFYHHCQTEYRAHQRYGPRFKWGYDTLKRILESLQDYRINKRFYLIIDAVDEFEEKDRRDILGLFLELCSEMKHAVVKVFMASRPVAQLEARRDQFHNFIKMDDETRSDIYNYAQSQLEQLIEAHEEGYSEEEVFELLKQLLTELEDFYGLMLEKMKQNKSSLLHAAKLFQFILFARRPLTVDEVLHVLGIPDSIDSDPKFIPSDALFEKRIPSSERVILSSGGNFLEIKNHNGNQIVQIMHQTVREFFLNPDGPVANSAFWVSETHAHSNIAITCIRYLSVCATNTSVVGKLPNIKDWDMAHFKDYCQYIKSHIESSEQDANIEYATSQFIELLTNSDPGASLLERWASSRLQQGSLSENSTQDAIATPLLWAAKNGHREIVKLLGEKGAVYRSADGHNRTPLSWAAEYGHLDIVELLIEKGVGTDTPDLGDKTPLSWAAEHGHLAVVKVLIEEDADMEYRDTFRKTPLLWAVKHGHLAIVKLLSEKGANVDSGDIFQRKSLSWAAQYDHLAVVKFLVDKGVDMEDRDCDGKKSLSWAAEHGHLAVVKFLAENGADIEHSDNLHKTPLSWAVENNHLNTVKFLVETGANIETEDCCGRTPVSRAVANKRLDIVKFLIERC